MNDTMKRPTGTLSLRAFDTDGRELWQFAGHNLIVAGGYDATARALGGDDDSLIAQVAVGTNGTPPRENDMLITDAVYVKVDNVEYPMQGTVRFNFTIGYDDAVGMAICEFGLITGAGRLFARKVRETIEKTAHMSIVGAWEINTR